MGVKNIIQAYLDTIRSKVEYNEGDIWKAIRANRQRLSECSGPHEFFPCEWFSTGTPKRHGCSRCGGVADADQVRWYELGLQHGRQKTLKLVK